MKKLSYTDLVGYEFYTHKDGDAITTTAVNALYGIGPDYLHTYKGPFAHIKTLLLLAACTRDFAKYINGSHNGMPRATRWVEEIFADCEFKNSLDEVHKGSEFQSDDQCLIPHESCTGSELECQDLTYRRVMIRISIPGGLGSGTLCVDPYDSDGFLNRRVLSPLDAYISLHGTIEMIRMFRS